MHVTIIAQPGRFLAEAQRIPAEHRHHQRDQGGCFLPYAADRAELIHRRLQHALEAAKGIQQPVRQRIDVPPGAGIEQQQLQHLMGRKPFQPLGAEALPQPLTVSIVI